ncbi:MAG: hypothetical protein U1D55_13090 [Phycisphaerae bacterium]
MNENDRLLFNATLTNTGGTGNTGAILSMDAVGNLFKVQRNGDVAIPSGAPNGSDAFLLSTTNIHLNSMGQVAFAATLTGTCVSPGLGNGIAIFATDLEVFTLDFGGGASGVYVAHIPEPASALGLVLGLLLLAPRRGKE